MRAAALLLVVVIAFCARAAAALESATWPPPQPVQERMHSLQRVIIDPASTAPEREAAREELSGLLKSPAGQARGPFDCSIVEISEKSYVFSHRSVQQAWLLWYVGDVCVPLIEGQFACQLVVDQILPRVRCAQLQ